MRVPADSAAAWVPRRRHSTLASAQGSPRHPRRRRSARRASSLDRTAPVARSRHRWVPGGCHLPRKRAVRGSGAPRSRPRTARLPDADCSAGTRSVCASNRTFPSSGGPATMSGTTPCRGRQGQRRTWIASIQEIRHRPLEPPGADALAPRGCQRAFRSKGRSAALRCGILVLREGVAHEVQPHIRYTDLAVPARERGARTSVRAVRVNGDPARRMRGGECRCPPEPEAGEPEHGLHHGLGGAPSAKRHRRWQAA